MSSYRCISHILLEPHHGELASTISPQRLRVLHFTGVAYRLLDGRLRVESVALQNIDVVELEALQAILHASKDSLFQAYRS
jgi:hypothetical protein